MRTDKRGQFDPDNLSAREAVIIACGIFLVFGLFAAFGPDTNVKFGGLTLDSAILFGYFIHNSRKYLRYFRFWLLTASLLVIHLLLWITFLMHVEKWGLMGFSIMVFELPIFWHLRDRPGLLN